MDIDEKYNLLVSILRPLRRAVLAYSGGVDSNFLLKVTAESLERENVVACLGVSGLLCPHQKEQALLMGEKLGVCVRQVELDIINNHEFTVNKPDRCFHCKSHLYSKLSEIAEAEGIEYVICGSNADDLGDFRPGERAAKIFNVRSPLREAGLTKNEIRELSRRFGLETADMPATTCLATRVCYGLEITPERLMQVGEAEEFIRGLGIAEFRVRHHGDTARIEVRDEDNEKIIKQRGKIAERLRALGFVYVCLDLKGFQNGSMNEVLSDKEKQKYL